MAYQCQDPTRKQELLQIASNCTRVPEKGARNFYEACQSFWFVQQLIQMEQRGHSISPGRFDQYMYPYYKSDMEAGNLTREFAHHDEVIIPATMQNRVPFPLADCQGE